MAKPRARMAMPPEAPQKQSGLSSSLRSLRVKARMPGMLLALSLANSARRLEQQLHRATPCCGSDVTNVANQVSQMWHTCNLLHAGLEMIGMSSTVHGNIELF